MNRIFTFAAIVVLALSVLSCKPSAGPQVASGLEMIEVPAGSFTMGISVDNRRKVTHGIAQPVALDGFAISAKPVSQALWTEVMGKNPSYVKDPDAPVDMVSWADAAKFIKKLSKLSGKEYSLPTEAQWEYAHKVCGDKEFTAVAEWCLDSYDEVPEDATKDDYFVPMSLMVNPRGPKETSQKVARTTLERMSIDSHTRRAKVGFRLVQVTDDPLTEDILGPLDGTTIDREKIDAADGLPEKFSVGDVAFKMVKVQGGKYSMGFNESDSPYLDFKVPDNEKNAHEVTVSDFEIGETEVTVGLWHAVMGTVPIRSSLNGNSDFIHY